MKSEQGDSHFLLCGFADALAGRTEGEVVLLAELYEWGQMHEARWEVQTVAKVGLGSHLMTEGSNFVEDWDNLVPMEGRDAVLLVDGSGRSAHTVHEAQVVLQNTKALLEALLLLDVLHAIQGVEVGRHNSKTVDLSAGRQPEGAEALGVVLQAARYVLELPSTGT